MLEYDFLFMKHEADLGSCKILDHSIDIEPKVTPHREGACAMTPDKASQANEEVVTFIRLRNDSALLLSIGKWTCDGKEKTWRDEILLCFSTFRPLAEWSVMAYVILREYDKSEDLVKIPYKHSLAEACGIKKQNHTLRCAEVRSFCIPFINGKRSAF